MFLKVYHTNEFFAACVNSYEGDIKNIVKTVNEAKRMGENGRKAVKEEFNWGVQETKLVALYQDILKD